MNRNFPHLSQRYRIGRLRGHRAFTLLEIVVSLSIIAIIGTMFAVNFAGDSGKEILLPPSIALKRMAMTANRQAAAFRDELRITFFADAFFVSRVPIEERQQAEERATESYIISPQDPVSLELRRPGNPKWIKPGNTGIEWLFQPAGLCEPLEVRFSNESGYIEMVFNPMTATVDDETAEFR